MPEATSSLHLPKRSQTPPRICICFSNTIVTLKWYKSWLINSFAQSPRANKPLGDLPVVQSVDKPCRVSSKKITSKITALNPLLLLCPCAFQPTLRCTRTIAPVDSAASHSIEWDAENQAQHIGTNAILTNLYRTAIHG